MCSGHSGRWRAAPTGGNRVGEVVATYRRCVRGRARLAALIAGLGLAVALGACEAQEGFRPKLPPIFLNPTAPSPTAEAIDVGREAEPVVVQPETGLPAAARYPGSDTYLNPEIARAEFAEQEEGIILNFENI